MAKKVKAEETVEVAPQPAATKKAVAVKPVKPEWEYKDRTYVLKGRKTPLVYAMNSKHTQRKPLLYFDKELGYQRELRYATNQPTPFVDEQKGTSTLGRIMFRDGTLTVKKEDVTLQKLLSLYHPYKDKVYTEFDPVQISTNELDWIELEFKAVSLAREMDITEAEGVLRTEFGSKVTELSSSELKRDLLIFAKRNPGLFIELATDENVQLRNVGARAVEQGILRLSQDQRTFTYGESNRKLMTVPFDEHPYSALAAFFKTDEGMEIYKALIKKLK